MVYIAIMVIPTVIMTMTTLMSVWTAIMLSREETRGRSARQIIRLPGAGGQAWAGRQGQEGAAAGDRICISAPTGSNALRLCVIMPGVIATPPHSSSNMNSRVVFRQPLPSQSRSWRWAVWTNCRVGVPRLPFCEARTPLLC